MKNINIFIVKSVLIEIVESSAVYYIKMFI
uniref:Uncharacterized protein n=1 Tax=viral metagenome TaxID=1070528 RepID=A0A6C0EGD3_9ZZZZ